MGIVNLPSAPHVAVAFTSQSVSREMVRASTSAPAAGKPSGISTLPFMGKDLTACARQVPAPNAAVNKMIVTKQT